MKKSIGGILLIVLALVLGYVLLGEEETYELPQVIRSIGGGAELSQEDVYVGRYPQQGGLDLHSRELTNIPDLCALLKPEDHEKVMLLSLANNKITKVDQDLSCLKNLAFIDLGFNNIRRWKTLGDLPNVETLKLGNNEFEDIDLPAFPVLKNLELPYNELEELEDLEQYPLLEELQIQHNELEEVEGVEALEHLKVFKAEFNELEDVSFLEGLENLELVTLKFNEALSEELVVSFDEMNQAYIEKVQEATQVK